MSRKGENIRRRSDGRWEARVLLGHETTGKTIYRSIYGNTYAEVREKRNILLAERILIEAEAKKRETTLKELAEEWLAFIKKDVKESTYVKYHQVVFSHIIPPLGKMRVCMLDTFILERYIREKLSRGNLNTGESLAAKTVTDILTILKQIISYGKKNGYPCMETKYICAPKQNSRTIQILSEGEQEILEKTLYTENSPICMGIMLSLYMGLRIGEVCALRWSDIRLTEGTIAVTRTVMRISNLDEQSGGKTRLLIDRPKTPSSVRLIPMPSFLCEYLSCAKKREDAYILTGKTVCMEPRNYFRAYKRIMDSCGLAQFNYHSLRHTFATRCIEKGFDAKTLSEILGHANVSITMKRYVHPTIQMKRNQMELLGTSSIWGQKTQF